MNYKEAILYLEKSCKFGSKQGHENFRRLMALFDNPQEKLKIIHVAGTNGKGSACAMISSVLKSEGYRVGVFTSPHLEKYNERFIVDGEYISDCDFTRHIEKVSVKVNELFKGTKEFFSFFEIVTAAAFNYFYEKNVDFAVIEVGMGGRLDATNIIEKPLLSVITSIGFDHIEYLGNTVSEIAREKAGIIKKNFPTVLYFQQKEVYNVISEICREKNSELFYTECYGEEIIERSSEHTIFNVKNYFFDYCGVVINMIGEYQVKNACNALMAVAALRKQGVSISDRAVFDGLENAHINGRMEVLKKEPLIILDGAHNIDGAVYLNVFTHNFKCKENKKIIMLIGILKDKNYIDMLHKMTEFCDTIILTQPDNKRAAKADELYNVISSCEKTVYVEDDLKKAVKLALEVTGKGDCLICSGSLYLIGSVRSYFKEVML